MSIKPVLFDHQKSLIICTSQEDAQLQKAQSAKKKELSAEYLCLENVQPLNKYQKNNLVNL